MNLLVGLLDLNSSNPPSSKCLRCIPFDTWLGQMQFCQEMKMGKKGWYSSAATYADFWDARAVLETSSRLEQCEGDEIPLPHCVAPLPLVPVD